MEGIGCLFGALVMAGIYLLPTFIAMAMHNINALGIFLLNLFTGWTFIGWVVALIFAVWR